MSTATKTTRETGDHNPPRGAAAQLRSSGALVRPSGRSSSSGGSLGIERLRECAINLLGRLGGVTVLDLDCGTGRNFPTLVCRVGQRATHDCVPPPDRSLPENPCKLRPRRPPPYCNPRADAGGSVRGTIDATQAHALGFALAQHGAGETRHSMSIALPSTRPRRQRWPRREIDGVRDGWQDGAARPANPGRPSHSQLEFPGFRGQRL